MLEIGKIKLNSNLFLGPMAGYTERVFRSLCLKKGAALAFTEMVSCEGLFRDSKNTMALMTRGKYEENLAVQLFMPNEESAARSLENVMKANPQILDINCGCPVPKVVKTGCGSALLRTPETIGKIVKVLCTTGLPITVKIRTGWDKNSINYLEVANKAFDNGAAAVCMHARTKSQLYSPVADWKALKDLKAHFPEKTIIGSGDLFTAADGRRMLEQTGVDAVEYARGAIGNPFIFRQTLQPDYEPSSEEKKEALFEHLRGLVEYMGENAGCREMRKNAGAYIKGCTGCSAAKQKISQALTIEDYINALKDVF